MRVGSYLIVNKQLTTEFARRDKAPAHGASYPRVFHMVFHRENPKEI
jgi:hypothetical protein